MNIIIQITLWRWFKKYVQNRRDVDFLDKYIFFSRFSSRRPYRIWTLPRSHRRSLILKVWTTFLSAHIYTDHYFSIVLLSDMCCFSNFLLKIIRTKTSCAMLSLPLFSKEKPKKRAWVKEWLLKRTRFPEKFAKWTEIRSKGLVYLFGNRCRYIFKVGNWKLCHTYLKDRIQLLGKP